MSSAQIQLAGPFLGLAVCLGLYPSKDAGILSCSTLMHLFPQTNHFKPVTPFWVAKHILAVLSIFSSICNANIFLLIFYLGGKVER
jgi:hypothetical protein